MTRYDKDVHERVARAPAVTEGRTGKRPSGAAGAAAAASASPRSASGAAPSSGRSAAPSSPSVAAPSVPPSGGEGNPALRRARPSSSRKALKPEGVFAVMLVLASGWCQGLGSTYHQGEQCAYGLSLLGGVRGVRGVLSSPPHPTYF